jgi:hypothetical protein
MGVEVVSGVPSAETICINVDFRQSKKVPFEF